VNDFLVGSLDYYRRFDIVLNKSMSYMYDQCRILYYIYMANREGERITMSDLIENEDLKFMHKVGNLVPALNRLQLTGYVEERNGGLQLTRDGHLTTEMLFRKFLEYMKTSSPQELETWINALERHKNSSWELIRDAYFHIHKQPLMERAFHDYPNDLENLENITFEVKQPETDLATLIDNVFQDIGDIDRLFKHKLGQKLFCIPNETHSIMNKATRGREINYTNFIGSIGLVIDGICHHEIRNLLEPGKNFNCSINEIESILKHNNIHYNPDTITTLRKIRRLRNKTLPIHDTGSEVVDLLPELGLTFPIKNHRDAAFTILRILRSCLEEMKTWFASGPQRNITRLTCL
jgi:hypothetical protein